MHVMIFYVIFLFCSYYTTPSFFSFSFSLFPPILYPFFLFIYIVYIPLLRYHVITSFLSLYKAAFMV